MKDLQGMRVALLEERMSAEMAALVRRHGGEPYAVPAVRQTGIDCRQQVDAFIDALAQGCYAAVIFLTGAGATALFREADQCGRLPELLQAARRLTTICRGPKPAAALARHSLPVSVTVPPPHTGAELLAAVSGCGLEDAAVALLHYGERDVALAQALRARVARLEELCLYEWRLPEDLGPLRTLVNEIIAGRVGAVTFTSRVQARHLFAVAAEMGQTEAVRAALNAGLVASLGPTCAAALRDLGVTPHVVPEHAKMGQLIVALAERVQADGGA